jgi:hypothetical protein
MTPLHLQLEQNQHQSSNLHVGCSILEHLQLYSAPWQSTTLPRQALRKRVLPLGGGGTLLMASVCQLR